jgi:hypothetical protein
MPCRVKVCGRRGAIGAVWGVLADLGKSILDVGRVLSLYQIECGVFKEG